MYLLFLLYLAGGHILWQLPCLSYQQYQSWSCMCSREFPEIYVQLTSWFHPVGIQPVLRHEQLWYVLKTSNLNFKTKIPALFLLMISWRFRINKSWSDHKVADTLEFPFHYLFQERNGIFIKLLIPWWLVLLSTPAAVQSSGNIWRMILRPIFLFK